MPPLIAAFLPALPAAPLREVLRAAAGAAAGIAACVLAVLLWPAGAGLPLELLAPLGATAVLMFAVPNSPLAQPWSAVAGNGGSALAAVLLLKLLPAGWAPGLGPVLAVGLAIGVMLLLRALHPPGGAVALLAALNPEPVLAAGWGYALVPVALLTAVLVLAAVAVNRLGGRVYPFRHLPQSADASQAQTALAAGQLGLDAGELEALLQRFRQSSNIGAADLGRLLAAAEEEAAKHRFDGVTCARIMSRDLITVAPGTPLAEAARLFRAHDIKSLPVIAQDGSFAGMIREGDLVDAVLRQEERGMFRPARLQRLTARDVMQPPPPAVPGDMPAGVLLNRLSVQGPQTVPVLCGGRLAGIITRSDIISLLLERAGGPPASALPV